MIGALSCVVDELSKVPPVLAEASPEDVGALAIASWASPVILRAPPVILPANDWKSAYY